MTGKTVILVVEDEPVLLMAASDLVENAGFEVVEAANAAQAVRILESRFDVRIVFSDIDMPSGIDGVKLAEIIRDRWPPIEIILVSGHRAPLAAELPARAVFFPKPYVERDIVAALRKLAV